MTATAPTMEAEATHIGRIRPTRLADAFCVLARGGGGPQRKASKTSVRPSASQRGAIGRRWSTPNGDGPPSLVVVLTGSSERRARFERPQRVDCAWGRFRKLYKPRNQCCSETPQNLFSTASVNCGERRWVSQTVRRPQVRSSLHARSTASASSASLKLTVYRFLRFRRGIHCLCTTTRP